MAMQPGNMPVPPVPSALPVFRRRALPPNNLGASNRPSPTHAQQNDLIEALRNQVRFAHLQYRPLLVRHLMANNWEVHLAAASIRQEESRTTGQGGLLPTDYQSTPASTVGGSRLAAMRDVRNRLTVRSTGQAPRLTNTIVTTLLQRNRFMVADTVDDIEGREGHFDDILDSVGSLRTRHPNSMQQDERLANFVTLTSTNSVSSARALLQQRRWDYNRAIDAWARGGELRLVANPDSRARSRRARFDLRGFSANGHLDINRPATSSQLLDDNASDVSDAGFLSDISLKDVSDIDDPDEMDIDEYSKKPHMRKGYLVDNDHNAAKIGCADASKLRLELIRDGKYRCRYFPGQGKATKGGGYKPFRWNDESESDDEGKPEFNWSASKDIAKLNRWREEERRRVTGDRVTHKGPSTPFHREELEWIWGRQQEYFESKYWEMAGVRSMNDTFPPSALDPDHAIDSNGNMYPLDLAAANAFFGTAGDAKKFDFLHPQPMINQWTREFNEHFAGRSLWAGGPPRQERLPSGIRLQLHRARNFAARCDGGWNTLSIVEELGTLLQSAHRQAANTEEGEEEAEEESDEE